MTDPRRGDMGDVEEEACSGTTLVGVLVRLVALSAVAFALPVAIYVSHETGLIRMFLSELNAMTAVLLVLAVNVLAFVQVVVLWAIWTTIRRDVRHLRATGAVTRLLPVGRTRPG
jgi:hypothetical protein